MSFTERKKRENKRKEKKEEKYLCKRLWGGRGGGREKGKKGEERDSPQQKILKANFDQFSSWLGICKIENGKCLRFKSRFNR